MSSIQVPEVIKVEQMLKSLVFWLAEILEGNYRNLKISKNKNFLQD